MRGLSAHAAVFICGFFADRGPGALLGKAQRKNHGKSREGGACCGRGCRLRAAMRVFRYGGESVRRRGHFRGDPSGGTLLAVFLATSDEAVLILLGNPQYAPEVGRLLAVKVVIAIAGGYVADLCLKDRLSGKKEEGVLCVNCGCHADHAGILMPAWRHTFRLFLYLFLFTWILDLCVEIFGIQGLSEFLLGDTVFQPVIAAVIGLIPNCAASVILTELYLSGAISFASVVSGLCTGAGAGLIVLFKVNRNRKENVKIMIMLYIVAVAAGLLLQFVN